MIVYGDPAVRSSARHWLADLSQRAALLDVQLDDLRALLIRAGQFEQAASDAELDVADSATEITDTAARAFCAAYAEEEPVLSRDVLRHREVLTQLQRWLEKELPERTLTLKIPEGYAFYALYPEQYCQAARRWASRHAAAGSKRVLVVGIRSIGTSLSAVVAVTLSALGWQTTRLTVRPLGDPFARAAEIPELARDKPGRAIVVDEGPGLSGSSMKAVAEALFRKGFRSEHISVFPGHGGEPGVAASSEVREWWKTVRRYCVANSELRWKGQTLAESLTSRAAEICDDDTLEPGLDLSAGRWRERVFPTERNWPAVVTAFERAKYRCRSRTRSVLWKFGGLQGVDIGASRSSMLLDWLPQPLATFRGFIALPWIDGQPLTRDAAVEPAVIRQIARHVVALSGSPLPHGEHKAAIARLGEMLYWNARESLGDELADAGKRLTDLACESPPSPTYGDGHLAPHEWIRDARGKIWKTDYFGHAQDHTVVGEQSVLWDAAGALIEWGFAPGAVRIFLETLCVADTQLDLRSLDFYCAAYAAFRLGLFSIATPDDAAEQRRVELAKDYYRTALGEILRAARENNYEQFTPRTRTVQASTARMLNLAGMTSRR